MYDKFSGAAYDLSNFEVDELEQERERKQREKTELKLNEKKSVAKTGSILKTTAGIICAGSIAFMMLYSQVCLSELTMQIGEKTTELEEAKSENVRLQSNLDNMVTLSKVEESAVNELGLQKTQKSQVKYITTNSENMVEVAEEQNNVFVSIQEWVYSILEYLGF